MKSFRFYFRYRPTIISPVKRRDDYSVEELSQFRNDFGGQWKYRKRKALPFFVGLGAWAIGMPATYIFAGARFGECFLGLMLFFLGLITYAAVFVMWFPRCPACGNETDEYPGEYCQYCPQCGEQAIGAANWLTAPKCANCGITLRFGKERQFKIHYCTSCGVLLDDKGV